MEERGSIDMVLNEKRFGKWVAKQIKPRIWKIYLEDKHLTLTGSADTLDLPINAFHTLERFEFTQNNSSDVANISSFDLSIIKKISSDPEVPNSRSTLWSKTGLAYSDYGVNFTKDNFEREPTTYTITITGTATNRMIPIIYLEGDL